MTPLTNYDMLASVEGAGPVNVCPSILHLATLAQVMAVLYVVHPDSATSSTHPLTTQPPSTTAAIALCSVQATTMHVLHLLAQQARSASSLMASASFIRRAICEP